MLRHIDSKTVDSPVLSGMASHMHMSVRFVSKSETIFYTGQRAHSLFKLNYGRIKFSQYCESGREIISDICGPNDIFGLEVYTGNYYKTFAITLSDCGFEIIPKDSIFNCKNRMLEAYHRQHIDMLAQLNQMHLSATKKLALFLLRQAKRFGVTRSHGWLELDLMLSHNEIGYCINMSRPSVSKSMNELRKLGVLRNNRRKTYELHPAYLSSRFDIEL